MKCRCDFCGLVRRVFPGRGGWLLCAKCFGATRTKKTSYGFRLVKR